MQLADLHAIMQTSPHAEIILRLRQEKILTQLGLEINFLKEGN